MLICIFVWMWDSVAVACSLQQILGNVVLVKSLINIFLKTEHIRKIFLTIDDGPSCLSTVSAKSLQNHCKITHDNNLNTNHYYDKGGRGKMTIASYDGDSPFSFKKLVLICIPERCRFLPLSCNSGPTINYCDLTVSILTMHINVFFFSLFFFRFDPLPY